ncbi:M36 family metallopeptidase [Pendulispora rubella]
MGLPMCANDAPSPASPPKAEERPDDSGARAALASTPLGYVVSRDARGAARWIVGSNEATAAVLDASVSEETAARVHLSRHAALLGITEAAVYEISRVGLQKLAGGATIVQFAQRAGDMDVFHARASVVLDASKNLVSIGANLHPQAAQTHALKALDFPKSAESALADAYAGQFGVSISATAVKDAGGRGAFRRYAVTTAEDTPAVLEAAAKRVLFPEGEQLLPAYYIELAARANGSPENEAYAYVIGAADGRVLYRASLTASDSFKYRVWADPTGNHIPADGPYVDSSPHPTGIPNNQLPDYAAPILVSADGFNVHADPWLGPSDTTTFGNNVRAYSDRNDQHNGIGDGFDSGDIAPDVTAPKTFDRSFDPTKAPNASPDQIKAAATQLFYVNNWLHDYWYDSGFDEASGVAQLSNYGRGGVEGDPLRAEAQDGADFGQANNANMSTPSDGLSPRMQMFVWSGVANRAIETTPARTYSDPLGAAVFGPQQFDVTAPAVLANDGTTPTSDACEPLADLTGKIAVIDRGTCPFVQKAINAQNAGAAGILMINNVAGHVPVSPGVGDPTITIPLIGLSLEDGTTLKAALAAGELSAHIKRGPEVLHDGTIDNTIVAHEWGHYLHHRLVQCGSASCGGMSEGWADFTALHMVVRESDLDNELFGAAFPLSQYAAAGITNSGAYFGIRRAPYSANRAKNPFTFGHVRQSSTLPAGAPLSPAAPNMAEVHNVGEIWAETLFEGYINVLHAGQVLGRTFEQSKRRMSDYIVAGMKAAPPEPSFTEQRDAILASVWAMGEKEDFLALARGFAKRGLGSNAVAPPTSSISFDEAVENFDIRGKLQFIDAKIDDSGSSCDHDGVLDAGESGKLLIRVRNLGWITLRGSAVSAATTDPFVTLENNGAVTIESIDAFGVATASIGISANAIPLSRGELPIAIKIHNDNAIPKDADVQVNLLYNYDDVRNSSPVDNVESETPVWTFEHANPPLRAWSRQGDASNHVWHGNDIGALGDERLVSPDLVVGPGNFRITFKHRFQFETTPASGGSPAVYWDGGVLELSTDGGSTWADVANYTDPGYPQTLTTGAGNPLSGRKAWAGDSSGYPNYTTVSLNLGTQLQGKTVKVRFRIGSDEAAGAAGWDIDNIIFAGITNLPFPSIIDDRTTCPGLVVQASR